MSGGSSPRGESESGSSDKFSPDTNSEGGDDSKPRDDSSPVCANVFSDTGIVVAPNERKRTRQKMIFNVNRAAPGFMVVFVSNLSNTYSF
jgi:hypothetical protein